MKGKTSQNQLPGNMSGDIIGDRFHEENSDHPGSRSARQLAMEIVATDMEHLEKTVLHGELSLLLHYLNEPLKTFFEKGGME